MSYEVQGRQGHGWFGSGTGDGGADPVGAVLEGASGLAAGGGGAAFRAYLGDDGSAELREALPIWAGASGLDAGAFRRLVVGAGLGAQGAAGLQEVGRRLASGNVAGAGVALAGVVAGEAADRVRYGLAYARDQAVYASVNGLVPDKMIVTAQLWLLTPKPPFFLQRGGTRLLPKAEAPGGHTVYRTDPKTGEVTRYEEFRPQTNPRDPKPWESVKRYDNDGKEHTNKATGEEVPTPHVHDPTVPGGVRAPTPDEIPKGPGWPPAVPDA